MKRSIQFILFTFGISWTMWGIQYLGQERILPESVQLFGMFGMFGPLFALLIMIKIEHKSYKETFKGFFSKAPFWVIAFAIISPMILSGLSYWIYFVFEDGIPEPLGVTLLSFVPTAFIILFTGGPIEEFGWRGYLLPQLRRHYSVVITLVIIGVIHGLWHLPLHYLNGTVQQALPIYEFLLITIAITASYVFIYEYTKSLIPMIILHWFANFSSAIFPYFYSVQGRYALLVFTLIFDAVLLYLLHKRESILIKPQLQENPNE